VALRVLHVVNRRVAESVPFELAGHLHGPRASVQVAVLQPSAPGAPGVPPGVELVELGARLAADPRAVLGLRRLVRQPDLDLVHVHHATSAVVVAALLAGRRGRPRLVKTEHQDHEHQRVHQNLLGWLCHLVCDLVLYNSAATGRSLGRLGRRTVRGKDRVAHNGVDLGRIGARRARPPATGAPVALGTVGRLVPQKNHRAVLAAVGRLLDDGVDATYELVGGGPQADELREAVAATGCADRITLAGPLPRDEVYDRLAGYHGFVVGSRWEGFCNAAVEAMAVGLPVAAADIPVLREVVGPGALFFDPDDPASIESALRSLVSLPADERAERVAALRRRAEEDLSIEAAAERYLSAYEQLLDRTPGPA